MAKKDTKIYCECGNELAVVGRAPVGKSQPQYCLPCYELPPPKDLNIGLINGKQRDEDRYVPRAGGEVTIGSTWSSFI